MGYVQGTRLREEAKAIATNRRQNKLKHRMVQRWVYDRYKPNTARDDDEAQVDAYDSSGSSQNAFVGVKPPKGPVWQLPVSLNGQLGPRGLTLGTMLQVARQSYQLSAHDFDTMSLFDHICRIQEALSSQGTQTPVLKTLVTKPLIVKALHQQDLARKDFMACIAKMAIHNNLPECFNKNFKQCQNCYDKFRPVGSCSCAKYNQTCLHGPCCYHPGQIKSWAHDSKNEDFLTKEEVTIQEFNIWIHQCYWDCCGAKLVALDPNAGRRNNKRKKAPPQPWEIANANDGSVGCTTLSQHVAMK
ncbi:hypothetical protein F5Y11DRAFT_243900 [Daldinia sp. FL1419]|nr:hypothetical protein F5Y11DRAFT_243900 [Daldinia sp. FL1419]